MKTLPKNTAPALNVRALNARTLDARTVNARTANARTANARSTISAIAAALVLSLLPLGAQAEITQDCIIEGTVDKRKADELGQPVYVKFRNARNGSEAGCSMNRRSKSRRVKFISTPSTDGIEDVSHGSKVKYRYIERDNGPGTWELIDIS